MKSLYIILLSLFFGCQNSPLTVKSMELCEYFTSDGICRTVLNKNHVYEIKIPKNKKLDNWDIFSNYLYFTARQTPGFIVRLNRNVGLKESKEFRESYTAHYDFSGIKGRMEGIEFGDSWIGSFQYLGSMLKDRQRHLRLERNYPNLTTLPPLKLSFKVSSSAGNISEDMEIALKAVYE
ncbi:MAG TPA: hypothetical protein PK453_08435 [Leptospiraceae bacterium]|nr:hypothetical protein [Leptospiraceae bacterium]HMY65910.1 hypothetical protein [Leptospiraceae bacterium]HNF13681.1 hypothetical protein [Leptospiraceae bacterium]HNI97039.1 hypothetical protein [Leptospiraceae bacterium]HNN04777.1 hypothetical protein [Leptospiraceae bacterium]